jgi:hypothetical protein
MAARAVVDLAVRHDGVAQRDERYTEDKFTRMRQTMFGERGPPSWPRWCSGEVSARDVRREVADGVVDAEVVDSE